MGSYLFSIQPKSYTYSISSSLAVVRIQSYAIPLCKLYVRERLLTLIDGHQRDERQS